MSDPDFERRLERMFAQPSRLADGDAFAARFETRLARGWGVRRLLVGAAGALGGVIAATQLVSAELLGRLEGLSPSIETLPRLTMPQVLTGAGLESGAMSQEVVWMTAAMLGLAAAFAATRWAEGV